MRAWLAFVSTRLLMMRLICQAVCRASRNIAPKLRLSNASPVMGQFKLSRVRSPKRYNQQDENSTFEELEKHENEKDKICHSIDEEFDITEIEAAARHKLLLASRLIKFRLTRYTSFITW
jgi:hypothetical protein